MYRTRRFLGTLFARIVRLASIVRRVRRVRRDETREYGPIKFAIYLRTILLLRRVAHRDGRRLKITKRTNLGSLCLSLSLGAAWKSRREMDGRAAPLCVLLRARGTSAFGGPKITENGSPSESTSPKDARGRVSTEFRQLCEILRFREFDRVRVVYTLFSCHRSLNILK